MATYVSGRPVDPIRKFRFEVFSTVPSDLLPQGKVGFTEVDGLNLGETEIVEYADGNDLFVRKLPGRTKYGNVTLKKGIDLGRHLASWADRVNHTLRDASVLSGPKALDEFEAQTTTRASGGNSMRATLRVRVADRAVAATAGGFPDPVYQEWVLENAWPSSYTLDMLAGGDSAVLVESCVLAVERIYLITPNVVAA